MESDGKKKTKGKNRKSDKGRGAWNRNLVKRNKNNFVENKKQLRHKDIPLKRNARSCRPLWRRKITKSIPFYQVNRSEQKRSKTRKKRIHFKRIFRFGKYWLKKKCNAKQKRSRSRWFENEKAAQIKRPINNQDLTEMTAQNRTTNHLSKKKWNKISNSVDVAPSGRCRHTNKKKPRKNGAAKKKE